ncbi:DUF1295 domain-containing protein [Novosphingobium huizhouense]|uniref:DUF1295 domain-containing protein n=1 Tax=Novosphingobium huizhouense TaxID=2866625 RepID=UPI001CD8C43F|nr:DUF1295 domain-containing protein [Novosphingobium huizhouense]
MTDALLVNAAALALAMLVLWRVAVRIGDVSFVDAVWAGGMAALALLSLAQAGSGAAARALPIAAATAIWGARLGLHLFRRWRATGEDPRYARILGKAKAEGRFAFAALTTVFAMQGLLLFATCLPAQFGILAPGGAQIGPLVVAGGLLWLVGFVFESVGDAQLARFRADPANQGKVLDTGLWRYTRHPNYFGDACVWWGIWLMSADAGGLVALAGLIGPVFLTFTLTQWSGKPMLERGMAKRRPGYADYVRRTSGFIPLPPRK